MKRVACFAAAAVLTGCMSAPPSDAAQMPPEVDPLFTEVESGATTEPVSVARLESGTRTYRRLSEDLPAGEYTVTLSREGEEWVARANLDVFGGTSAGLVHQTEELRFRASDLTPISNRHRQVQGPMELEVELLQLDGRLTGRVRLPPEMGGEQELSTEVPEGTLLSGMEEFLLATANLHEGWATTRHVFHVLPELEDFRVASDELRWALREERAINWSAFNLTIGVLAPVTYRVTGVEEVTVPAGTFPTYRVEVTGESHPRTVFVRRDPPHIVLRQEVPTLQLTVELEELRSP